MIIRPKKTAKRIIALILCLVFMVAFMLCAMNCAKYILHRCNNSDCRICDLLFNVDHIIKQFVCAAELIAIIICTNAILQLIFCNLSEYACTLVRLKIRLNQ